jgi:hypothetical protein
MAEDPGLGDITIQRRPRVGGHVEQAVPLVKVNGKFIQQ